jgi:phosphate starvation-inducible protein PhoH and related proteins
MGKPRANREGKSKYQDKQVVKEVRKDFNLKPMNSKQKEYISLIKTKQVVLAFGPAGTSKTFVPSVMAAQMFTNKDIHNITIVRPYEGCGKSVGLLPGELSSKLAPVCQPVIDVFNKYLGKSAVEYAISHGQINMQALEFVRGITFDDTFVILDEAQNIDINSIKALLTRVGENCKVVISGDVKQKDIKGDSGLSWLISLLQKADLDVGVVEFGNEHIVRSGFVKDFILAVERYG